MILDGGLPCCLMHLPTCLQVAAARVPGLCTHGSEPVSSLFQLHVTTTSQQRPARPAHTATISLVGLACDNKSVKKFLHTIQSHGETGPGFWETVGFVESVGPHLW